MRSHKSSSSPWRKPWQTAIGALVSNLLLVYVAFMLTRLLFVACNSSLFASHLSMSYLLRLLLAGLRFDTTAILYLNCWLILAFLLPLHWKERRGYYQMLRVLFVAVNMLGLTANLCDCAYFPFTGRRTTWSVLQEFGGEGNFLTILWHEALPYFYLFPVGGLLIWVLWKLFVRPQPGWHKAFSRLWHYYVWQALALLVAVVLTIGGVRGGFTKAVRPITMSNANQYVDHAIDAAIVLNTPFCLLRTLTKKPFQEPHYLSDKEALALYSPLHEPSDSVRFVPRNVVVLILESFGKQALVRGRMPFVESLAERGLSFEYSYASGRKSIDGMPSVLSSIPSFVEPFFLTPAALNDLSGIAGELTAHKGYHSAFFHGAENGSMGFQAFARSSGFEDYYGRTEFNQDPNYHGDKDFDGTWAIWDEEFLQFYCDRMTEMPQPFVTSVFTASSHSPFRVPDRYAQRFPATDPPVFAPISYSDMALQRFFEKAAQQPWYANTLFVITADHACTSVDPEFTTDLGLYKVPVIFFSPSMPQLSGTDTTRIVSQTDIMPTILGLLGYDLPYVAFGQDVLHTNPDDTFAVNYLPTSGYYQFMQGDWMLQFDGERVVHAYRFKEDLLLQHDLVGQHPAVYEQRLQSIIQQYMHRMNHNQLREEKK